MLTMKSVPVPEKFNVVVFTVPFQVIVSVRTQPGRLGLVAETVPVTTKEVPVRVPVSVVPAVSVAVRFCPTCVTVMGIICCIPGKIPPQLVDCTVVIAV